MAFFAKTVDFCGIMRSEKIGKILQRLLYRI
jgi:hypothetical protein